MTHSGPSQRYYGKPGDPALCGPERIGTYAGANAHWRKREDPCTRCGEAARAYWRDRRAAMKARPVETWPHGTRRCYVDFGCRRDECRAAMLAYRARNNAARAALGLPGH